MERKPKTTTAQDMLKIWNEALPKGQSSMSKDLAPLLVSAFKRKFHEDLSCFKHYCMKIKSSEYMMNDSFQLSIFWALKFSVIDRIQNGELGVKDIPLQKSERHQQQDALLHIESVKECPKCIALRHKILKDRGAAEYLSWFVCGELSFSDGRFYFSSQSSFISDYVEQKFLHFLNPKDH